MPIRSQRHRAEIQGSGAATGPTIAAWVAGAGTLTPIPIVGGKARVEALNATDNPRIVKQISGLIAGRTYRINTMHTQGNTANPAFYRVDDSPSVANGIYANQSQGNTGPVDIPFVAPAGGMVYYGVIQIGGATGDFCQTDNVFTLTLVVP
jgi:hypothetical protein